jgi:hypothetical protein
MDNKVFELAKKLNELAKRGEGGEKVNAQLKLNALMVKHNITLSQLEGVEITKRKFYINSDIESTILIQVVAKVLNMSQIKNYVNRDSRTRRFIAFELTDVQFIDVDAHFAFYWAIFLKEQDNFVHAFCQAQNLFSNVPKQKSQQTPEQKEELKRILKMSDSIQKMDFHRPLNTV